MKKNLVLYTDGACSCNPGPGGWGALVVCDQIKETISGGDKMTTNNRMELSGAIEGLKFCKNFVDIGFLNSLNKNAICDCLHIDLYTDSKYVRDGITLWIKKWSENNWKTSAKSDVKNRDLWEQLVKIVEELDVTWHWVQGHNGDVYNEEVDQLARSACKKFQF